MRETVFYGRAPEGRSSYWDNLKGVLIALVVFAHCLYPFQDRTLVNFLTDSIYFFHMPAFVFVSGLFSRRQSARSPRALGRLGFALLLLQALHLLLAVLFDRPLQLVSPYYSAWYLLALLLWRLTLPWLRRFRWTLPLLAAVSLLAGFWSEIDNRFALARVLALWPFFLAGALCTGEGLARLRAQAPWKKLLLGLGAFAAALAPEWLSVRYLGVGDADLVFAAYGERAGQALLGRICIWAAACLCILGLLLLTPRRRLPFLTRAGRNSLAVYLLHRPLTLAFALFVPGLSDGLLPAVSLLFTLACLLFLGSDRAARGVDRCLSFFTDAFFPEAGRSRNAAGRIAAVLLVLVMLAAPLLQAALWPRQSGQADDRRPIYPVAAPDRQQAFDGAFRLLFAGDLILLEDQVKRGCTEEGYDFSEVFAETRQYISGADLAVGVFEGPCAGPEAGYSAGNFDDGKVLYVSYPDEWAAAVKEAGFDLVTTANNHLLDRGQEGALRTLRVLDGLGLAHTGSYAGAEDKAANRVKLLEAGGLRFAFLSYTYGVNGLSPEELLQTCPSLTSLIVPEDDPCYDRVLAQVKADFTAARALAPDFIVVLPHWGTQFAREPDGLQLLWKQTFLELGADIILGDHTHSVQPVTVEDFGGRTVFTLFSPGNFANLYRDHDGDCSALVEVCIDRETKTILGGELIPLWTESAFRGNYRALPVYDLFTDEGLGRQISTRDMERAGQALEHVSAVMLGTRIDSNLLQKAYRFDKNGFFRDPVPALELTQALREGPLFRVLTEAETVCFVGDSLTEGTVNGGVGWFEPLRELVRGRILCRGWGGATVQTLLEDHGAEIAGAEAELFVIAVGTNDVRYRDERICAMDAAAYVERLQALRERILQDRPEARFVFVAPWTSTDGDAGTALPCAEKLELNRAYGEALAAWAKGNGDLFIDPNPYIEAVLALRPRSDYLLDAIHPNAGAGAALYAEAALLWREED